MAALGSQSIAQSYEQLLHVDRDGGGNSTTHVAIKDGDNGTTFGFTIATDALMMSSTNRLEFGDTGTYIHQSADGVLDLVSDTEIEINATTIDINGAVAMDGAMTGGTNITISGELDAATLDISGNADIDGTLEADAYTVDGTALDEFIADTVGAMVGSNTETGVAVTYEDGDNTLDFVLGAAQTTITSLLAADIKIGEDDQTKIDFETANEIHFYANNTEQVYVADNIFGPEADSDVDLGATGVRWKDAFVDSITVTGEVDAATLDISGAIDVAGTANLDVVDIDGAFTQDGGVVVFNEAGADYDFRVESNNNANMLFVDGGNDHVNIGTATDFGGTLNVATADNNVQFVIGSTDADANEGPIMDFYRNSASPATNDYTGVVRFRGENDNDEAISYAQIQTQMTGVGDGSEEGKFWISTMKAGDVRQRMSIAGGETIFNEDSVDVDFRVESNGNANMLVVDGGNNNVGIGVASPDSNSNLHIEGGGYKTLLIDTSSSGGGGVLVEQGGTQAAFFGTGGSSWLTGSATTDALIRAETNLIFATNGNNEKMRINSAGAVTAPTTPAFLAQPASDQLNFAEDSLVTVVFGAERFDQGSNFASNTFTAPVTGKYHLNVSVYFQDVQIEYNYYEVQLKTSNRTYYAIFDSGSLDQEATYHTLQVNVLADMDASDTAHVEVKAAGTSGDASHDIGTGSFFSGYLAC